MIKVEKTFVVQCTFPVSCEKLQHKTGIVFIDNNDCTNAANTENLLLAEDGITQLSMAFFQHKGVAKIDKVLHRRFSQN